MDSKTPKGKHFRGDPRTTSSLSPSFSDSANFSPVVVSPGRSPLRGQLTGIARKVKDSCADLHSATQKWQLYKKTGIELISEISNLKLQAIYARDALSQDEGRTTALKLPEEMESLCEKLLDTVQVMEKVVNKMVSVCRSLHAVCDLEWHQLNQSLSDEPLFQSWPTQQFGKSCDELLQMYRKELSLKEEVAQNVAHAQTRQLLMFYTALWLHEPYIEDRAKLVLESMLQETGHR